MEVTTEGQWLKPCRGDITKGGAEEVKSEK